MAQSDATFLKNKVALLADFSEEQLRNLADRSQIVAPGPGEIIVHAGEELHFLGVVLEGTTGKTSRFAPNRQEARWMRVTSEGRAVDADTMASRLRFNPEFADKLANELKPGTTVVVTDHTVVRKQVVQSDIFANN